MIDVSEILNDPDICQEFTILRSTDGKFVMGGWEDKTQQIPGYGAITVASSKQLEMLPEGDRPSGAMAFYSTQELFTTHVDPKPGTSDILLWRGEKYRIMQVKPWIDFGYWLAIATRISGA